MAERYQFGDCLFDADSLELWRGGQRLEARPRVLELLAHLLRHSERVVSKDELAQALWPGLFVSDGSLTQLVYELRRLLGEPHGAETWIRTVRGRGYRFAGISERVTSPEPGPGTSFVGRRAELAQLERALDAALAGRGRAVLLYGEPGIGKTTLALRLGERAAARRVDVQIARSGDGDDAPPFWAWTQLLRGLLRSRGVQEFRAAADRGLADVARIMPELNGATGNGPEVAAGDRFALFDAVSRLVLACARRRPIVAIFEDVHALDEASLRLLVLLVGLAADAPLLVVGTFRDGELGRTHPLMEALVQLRRTPSFESLGLRALADEEVAELVTSMVGSSPPRSFIDRACRLAEGNPFFAIELVRHWIANDVIDRTQSDWTNSSALAALGLPRSVHDVLRQRLAALSPGCVDVLQLAAVLGRVFDRSLLERASEQPPAQVAAALDEAFLAGVVRELPRSAGRQEFTHALLRESLYWDLPPQRRRRLHRAAADALEALHDPGSDEQLAALSHHFFQCAGPGELERPIRYGSEAAARACARLAFEEGVRQYRRVLDMIELVRGHPLAEQVELRLRLSEALEAAGRPEQATRERQAAVARARTADRPELLARAALAAATDLLPRLSRAGVPADVELLEEALAALPPDEAALRARVLAQLAVRLAGGPRAAEAGGFGEQAVGIAARLGDPVLLAHSRFVACLAGPGPGGARPDAQEPASVVELADQAGLADLALCARVLQVRALLEAGDIDRVESLAGDVARRAARLRTPRARCWALLLRASLAGLHGEQEQVDALLGAAREEAQRSDAEAEVDVLLLGVVLHDLYGARTERSAGMSELRGRAESASGGSAPAWLGWLGDAAGNELSKDALARELAQPDDGAWMLARRCALATCSVRLGDRSAASRLYEQLLPHAGRNAVAGPSFAVLAPVSLRLAQLASFLRRDDEASRHFEAAIERCGQQRMPAHQVRARLDYADHLLEHGGGSGSTKLDELIEAALLGARALGAPALVSRALAVRSARERMRV